MESPNSLYNNINNSGKEAGGNGGGGGGGGSGGGGGGGAGSFDSSDNIVIPSNFLISTKEIIARFPHNKRVGHYLLGRKLGEGSFAKVKEGLHTITGQKVAIKVIDKKKAKEDAYVSKNMRREGKLLQMIIHPNIIQLYELMETENSYYLVTELCESGDLMDYICARKYLSEAVTRKFIRQIISAVDYLHRIGILHRDLKIENLLLDKNLNIKLIDFGLSNYTKSELCITQCGSPAYAAPELLAHKKYGSKVDVWSIGVNMYAMLTGNLPFTVEPFNIKSLYNKMMKNEMNAIPEHLSKSGEDLLRKLLNPDPVKRISLKEAMDHPWLNEGYSAPLKPFPYPNKPTDEQVNATIMRYMNANMEFSLSEVLENIKVNKPSSALATYYLLLYKVKSMLSKIDPKKMPATAQQSLPNANSPISRISKPNATPNSVTTAATSVNNNNNNASSNPVTTTTTTTTAASIGGIVNVTNSSNNTAAYNQAANRNSVQNGKPMPQQQQQQQQQPDVLNKFATKPADRALSPMTMANNHSANNQQQPPPPNTTVPVVAFSGAMKNLTQKYKTMHLTNTVDDNHHATVTPPPPPTLVHSNNNNNNNNNSSRHVVGPSGGGVGTQSPMSNLFYTSPGNMKTATGTAPNHTGNNPQQQQPYSNTQHSMEVTAINNVTTLNSTLVHNSVDLMMTMNHKNSDPKSTSSSSSSSEENPAVGHLNNHHQHHHQTQQQYPPHVIAKPYQTPIIKTSNLVHRNSLNNGPSGGPGMSSLTHSNSTKVSANTAGGNAEWTQMIKLNSGKLAGAQVTLRGGPDLNNNDMIGRNSVASPINEQHTGVHLAPHHHHVMMGGSGNGGGSYGSAGKAGISSSSSSTGSSPNNVNGGVVSSRKSPIGQKLAATTSSPVTLPAIDTSRAITPQ